MGLLYLYMTEPTEVLCLWRYCAYENTMPVNTLYLRRYSSHNNAVPLNILGQIRHCFWKYCAYGYTTSVNIYCLWYFVLMKIHWSRRYKPIIYCVYEDNVFLNKLGEIRYCFWKYCTYEYTAFVKIDCLWHFVPMKIQWSWRYVPIILCLWRYCVFE
jgi:hypothetical protein